MSNAASKPSLLGNKTSAGGMSQTKPTFGSSTNVNPMGVGTKKEMPPAYNQGAAASKSRDNEMMLTKKIS